MNPHSQLFAVSGRHEYFCIAFFKIFEANLCAQILRETLKGSREKCKIQLGEHSNCIPVLSSSSCSMCKCTVTFSWLYHRAGLYPRLTLHKCSSDSWYTQVDKRHKSKPFPTIECEQRSRGAWCIWSERAGLCAAASQLWWQSSTQSEICVSSNTANDPESAELFLKYRKCGESFDEPH